MRNMLRMALAAIAVSVPVLAHADPVVVEADGGGPTRQAAVAEALVEAIQQLTGVAVAAVQEMSTAMASASGPDGSSATLTEKSQGEVLRKSNGIVRSYRILSLNEDEPAHFMAHLSVTVEKFQAKGLGNDSRRRIAVGGFTEPAGARGLGAMLRDRVTAALTQTRRFAVVDRVNDAAYAQEMTALANAPAAERVRVGQVIGADYVLVGVIRQASVSRSDETIELTGERVRSASSAIEADFQVLDIATRQVKWADTVRFSTGGDALNGLVARAAERIAENVAQTIYPMRLIKFDDPNELIINQGGTSLRPGQRFRAMIMGDQLTDPYTNEPLGQAEREFGTIEVQRVDPKISYARLVSGRLPATGSEIVLRPATAAASVRRAAAHASATSTRPVVKLPGDP